MSAGPTPVGTVEPMVDRDLHKLAPLFDEAVEKSLAEANADGYDAIVYEAGRSHELAQLYYARGRTIIPPHGTVTNAPDETYSWHGFLLAVDVISRKYEWFNNAAAKRDYPDPKERAKAASAWFAAVAGYFKRNGCKWGGDWKSKDEPHQQWGRCKASPSNEARRILATEGVVGVWRACKAIL